MFVVTGAAHFAPPLRRDLIAIVPPTLPAPGLLVSVTGVLELAGAVGLLMPATRGVAAVGLVLLMLAMFPANIYAARILSSAQVDDDATVGAHRRGDRVPGRGRGGRRRRLDARAETVFRQAQHVRSHRAD